ncbi:DNA damage tolerance protein RHC31 [[Candida] jaroonii]|uniref:DNA damage tolerance protein RHC31 n=1 Tax=[Candida] jaroonii TaxID=467808 RepID=A0ACA9Y554_9ASCO|nr:DNA damage tolerance protein RHC31 [[Candida] jaroonii]
MGTQLRLRSAKVLIINLGSVGMEIVKNLVLGGINSIDIVDDSVIKEEDYAAQFFLPNDDKFIGELKLPNIIEPIKELNNRVNINIHTDNFNQLLADKDFFKKFDLIIGTELVKQEIIELNELTRTFNIPLYVTGLHGIFGYIITDLIQHVSTVERNTINQAKTIGEELSLNKVVENYQVDKPNNKEILTIKDTYSPISSIFTSDNLPKQLSKRQLRKLSSSLPIILSLLESDRSELTTEEINLKAIQMCSNLGISPDILSKEYLQEFTNQQFTEFVPTSAILGGCLAQDVIQFLSKRESPINNTLILDGLRSEMPIYSL